MRELECELMTEEEVWSYLTEWIDEHPNTCPAGRYISIKRDLESAEWHPA